MCHHLQNSSQNLNNSHKGIGPTTWTDFVGDIVFFILAMKKFFVLNNARFEDFNSSFVPCNIINDIKLQREHSFISLVVF